MRDFINGDGQKNCNNKIKNTNNKLSIYQIKNSTMFMLAQLKVPMQQRGGFTLYVAICLSFSNKLNNELWLLSRNAFGFATTQTSTS